VKKIVIAAAIVLLILMNTVAYLLIYKKYNDLIDYFNQDSQLTSERLEGLDAKVKDVTTQFDDKTGTYGDRMATAFGSMQKDLSSRVGALENDIAAIKQKLGMKSQIRR